MIMSLKEVCETYSLSERWIKDRCRKKEFPFIQVHYRLKMFDREKVEEKLRSLQVSTDDEIDSIIAKDYFNNRKKK